MLMEWKEGGTFQAFHKNIHLTLISLSHWQRAPSRSYKYVPLCLIVLWTNAVSPLHISELVPISPMKQTLGWRCLLCFQVWMRGWWNQCCLLTICKLAVEVKRPKQCCLFLGIYNCTIVKWMSYWVLVVITG